MLKRIFVDIQGDLLDTWNIISVEKDEQYNENLAEMQYLLVVLKNSVNKEAEKKIYKFGDQETRDDLLYEIKHKLQSNPNIYFLGEDDGSINDDALQEMGYNKSGKKSNHQNDDGPEYEQGDE